MGVQPVLILSLRCPLPLGGILSWFLSWLSFRNCILGLFFDFLHCLGLVNLLRKDKRGRKGSNRFHLTGFKCLGGSFNWKGRGDYHVECRWGGNVYPDLVERFIAYLEAVTSTDPSNLGLKGILSLCYPNVIPLLLGLGSSFLILFQFLLESLHLQFSYS